ncbi:Hypothetical protein BHO_0011305 (plasmid) [Borrelia hermsii YBT]|uniref:YqaJ viral recombinase domain-containing protein n=1 Tax=Borrelia hermsii YBT TaxID=1313295 RepID=W5T3H7_BORHE|nr:DUF244 domain-containing protein [Borrelia hermsii]AHH13438.1 Hypothetical protein BHO_0011305 [Borrelia hermsii YBT]
MTNIKATKIDEKIVEGEMQHIGLHCQKVLEGFESFAHQSQDQINKKQKSVSKISRIGRKLPRIGKTECFKFNSKVDFGIQRNSLKRIGASEVGSMFIGAESVSKLMLDRVLKLLGREISFEENLSMRKGKILENLGFDEFVRMHSDEIFVLHKNKYANGIDKYNYFKKFKGRDNLVGSTIDGWFENQEDEAELLEIKCSDNLYLKSAVIEYNKNGNFLENKYFFKYYVQVQIQLLCTGLSKGNLFFLIGNEAINCVIERDDKFINEVMLDVSRMEAEVSSIAKTLRAKYDIEDLDLDSLSELIQEGIESSEVYKDFSESEYKDDFLEFVRCTDLEIDKEKDNRLKGCLSEISALQTEIEEAEEIAKNRHTQELYKATKPMKDKLKSRIDEIFAEFSLMEHVNYCFEGNLFSLDTTKRAIKDRFKSLSGNISFLASSLDSVQQWPDIATPIVSA